MSWLSSVYPLNPLSALDECLTCCTVRLYSKSTQALRHGTATLSSASWGPNPHHSSTPRHQMKNHLPDLCYPRKKFSNLCRASAYLNQSFPTAQTHFRNRHSLKRVVNTAPSFKENFTISILPASTSRVWDTHSADCTTGPWKALFPCALGCTWWFIQIS